MNIIDTQGVWLRNSANFPLFDPETFHVFAPKQVVKIRRSDWAKGQAVIEVVPDPLATAPVIAAVPTAGTKTVAPAAPAVKKLSPV